MLRLCQRRSVASPSSSGRTRTLLLLTGQGRRLATMFLLAVFALPMRPPTPSASGQEASLPTFRVAAEPLLSIGVQAGDPAFELFDVEGAVRLSDGSVVVMVRGHYEVRRFGPDGKHLWSVGRAGEGPMEFQLPALLPTCTKDDEIVIYDRLQYRVTVLDADGDPVDEYRLNFGDRSPYGDLKCSASQRIAFLQYADADQRPSKPGPYRWSMDVVYTDGEGGEATVVRRGIPGADRMLYFREGIPSSEGPLRWGRTVSIAPVDEGVWVGTADDYEIELLDWTGATRRRIRWEGPDLEVTSDHIDTYRDSLYRSYESRNRPDWRRRFNDMWQTRRPALPSTFPAYNTIMVFGDRIWVKHFRRPGEPEHQWLAFDADGDRVANMFLPSRFVAQQVGPDWVLVLIADELGMERLAVYALVEES